MKKILFLLVIVLSVSTMAKAQQRGGGMMRMSPEERAKRSVEQLSEKMTLSQSQQDSIYQFSLEGAKQQQALFQQGGNGDRQAAFAKMRNLNEETQKKIKGVLNEEQQKAYEELLKEQQARMGGMGGRRGGRG